MDNALQRMKTCRWIVLIAILAMGAGVAHAAVTPNLYELAGKNINISYTTASLTGDARLNYQDSRRNLVFTGNEIRVSRSELGQLVTVTIVQKPDLKTVTATLLIPDINLTEGPLLIKTYLIKTTNRTSIGGPDLVAGQVQTYGAKVLRGKASHVQFVQSNLSGQLTLSPTCPGPVQPGQDCVGPFAGAWVQVIDAVGNTAANAISDEEGLFEVSVAPGQYTVRAGAPLEQPLPQEPEPVTDLQRFPTCPDTKVLVPEVGGTFVRIDCDTGIR